MATDPTTGYFEVLVTTPLNPKAIRCLIRGDSWPAARARAIRWYGDNATITRVNKQERTLTGVPIKRYGQITAAVS